MSMFVRCGSLEEVSDYKLNFTESPYYEGMQRTPPTRPSLIGLSHSIEEQFGKIPLERPVTYKEVDEITRAAIERAGGLAQVIMPGDDWVLIKPNLLESPKRQTHVGTTVDLRVLKSLIQQILELPKEHHPKRISVGEGGGPWRGKAGFVDPYPEYDNMSVDGILKDFAIAYPEIKFDWIDFNTESRNNPLARDVPVPGGSLEFATYTIPEAVIKADKFIILSVLKTHEMIRATMTHKNYIGITPSTIYGTFGLGHFDLNHGGANPLDYRTEYDNSIDRTVTDLFSYHPADFALVECFHCTEENGPREGWEIRRNVVFAGKDPLALDAVSAHYMGINPLDLDYLHWSYARGHGNSFDLNMIEIEGPKGREGALDGVARLKEEHGLEDFVKHTLQPYQGRGIRSWLTHGPHDGRDLKKDYLDGQELKVKPTVGLVTGDKPWKTLGAYNDYIDLGRYYQGPSSCVTYAYTTVNSERVIEASLRFASDNGIRVFWNGKMVYSNSNTGTFPKGVGNVWVEAEVPVTLNPGENELMVKVYNQSGPYGFSMYVSEEDGDTPLGVTYPVYPTKFKKPVVGDGQVYWVDFFGSIKKVNVDGTGQAKMLSGRTVNRPDGIDLDPVKRKIYWTNMKGGTIYRGDLDGTNVERLIPQGVTETPKQLKLDLAGGKMYWSDRDDPKIMRANLDGSRPEVLIKRGLKSPVGMALDLEAGKIYFTDRFANRIMRANQDGSDVEVIVPDTVYPTDIVFDPSTQQIFWTSREDGLIYRADKDGQGVQIIVSGLNEPIGISVDSQRGLLFYSDVRLLSGSIYRAELDGTNQRKIAAGGAPLGVVYVPPSSN